jgi:hypothetical protein
MSSYDIVIISSAETLNNINKSIILNKYINGV